MFLLGFGIAMTVAGCALGGADKVSEVVKDVTGGKVDIGLGEDGFTGIKVGDVTSDDVIGKFKVIVDSKVYDLDDFGSMYDDKQETLKGDVEKFTISAKKVDKLELDLGGCTLNWITTSDSDFAIEGKNVDKMQAYVKGDTLHVISTKNGSITGSEIKKSVIDLYVPKDLDLDDIKIELGAGIIIADELSADDVTVELGAGEAQIKKVNCKDFEVKVGAGALKFDDGSVKKFKVKVGAGSFIFKGKIEGDAKVDCSAGSVELKLKNDDKDFDYQIDCAAGSVKVGDKRYSGLTKSDKIDNNADADFEIKCAAGSVQVDF